MKTTYPKDPARSLRKQQLLAEIGTEFYMLIKSPGSLIAVQISNLLSDRVPVIRICEDLSSQAKNNPAIYAGVLGETLLDKINEVCKL